ncbi:hypothetical protein [Methylocystis iwaonis]|uniref:hypothetical protein n=1 Tax=Methylocystis iwaonis TaxID=2885079 RepID=UPI002E7C4B24|nr:hypothetical protein [Methylocystis iwaonis]
MLIETLVTLIAAAAPAKPPPLVIAPAALFWRTPTPAYAPEKRAVDNWRVESALWLDMSPLAAAKRALDADDNEPARCVKLNNYWCVKSAGWNGEIAADADGHVAFASAEEGAAVAALLLRRYYVDYKRHSARAIIERWAPAQCATVAARATPPATARPAPSPAANAAPASRAGMMRMLPQRIVPMGIAPRGLQNTLRARWLAAHGRGDVGWGRRRAAPAAPDLIPAPSIMAGVSEARPKRAKTLAAPAPDTRLEATASLAALPPALPPLPTIDCSGELARIGNYAAHVSEGIAATPNDDLALFDATGRPTDNLARALANMAAVEIGPARPRSGLVNAAVAQLRRLLESPATPEATSQR